MTDLQTMYMQQALRLAENGLHTTHPNPRVGCLLVNDTGIVGEGWHQYAGQEHAEINALRNAGEKAQGATAYVTLEPCCHYGRTPPCTEALIKAGVKKVVVAMQDPNPQVAGKGLQQLSGHGIEVCSGVLEDQARALNLGFIKRMQDQLPFVRCKLATSLDGRTAMASGESKWISSEASRKDVQRLRAYSNAIMTGIGTVLADDPSLTVREQQLIPPEQPLRVVLDSNLKIPVDATMLSLPGEVYIVTTNQWDKTKQIKKEALEKMGVNIINVATQDNKIKLKEVLKILAQKEINDVLLECGATLAGAMLQENLLDQLVLYLAPHLMGDLAKGLFHFPEIKYMSERIALDIQDVRRFEKDIRIIANIKKADE